MPSFKSIDSSQRFRALITLAGDEIDAHSCHSFPCFLLALTDATYDLNRCHERGASRVARQ